MTDPDQPFRRPSHSIPGDDAGHAPSGHAIPHETVGRDEPIILDPELHPSVWKPWEEPKRPTSEETISEDVPVPPTPARWSMPSPAIIALSIAGVLALVAALLVPQVLPVPSWEQATPVADILTQPEIAWSAEGGDLCYPYLDDHHAVLTGTDRVRAVDLRDGKTTWSADTHGSGVETNCLPGANLVAITTKDYGTSEVSRITLIDGSTGEVVTELSGESTVQVIPLGPNVGLLDRDNMLRAFAPDRLDAPLWSRVIPGGPKGLNFISVQPVDDTSVMLWYSTVADGEGGDDSGIFTPVLSLMDGKSPPWFQASETDQQYYHRVGDVMARMHYDYDEGLKFAVVDLKGRELWNLVDAEPYFIGPRLFVALRSGDSKEGSWTKELVELDPRTGTQIGTDVYKGEFDYAAAFPGGNIALFEYNSVRILDGRLQEQAKIPVIEYGTTINGDKLLYVATHRNSDMSQGKQLLALDSSGSTVWTFDLEPGQEIQQMGRHLVLVDDYGASIHGLASTS